MSNNKKKNNGHKNHSQNNNNTAQKSNVNETEVLNKSAKTENSDKTEVLKKDETKKTQSKNQEVKTNIEKTDKTVEKKSTEKKSADKKENKNVKSESGEKQENNKNIKSQPVVHEAADLIKQASEERINSAIKNSVIGADVEGHNIISLKPRHFKIITITALKVLLPVAALAIVIAVVVSFSKDGKNEEIEQAAVGVEETSQVAGTVVLTEQPLSVNAHEAINTLMNRFYTALADGDVETIKALRDYNDETELITYEKKSEFIESYDNITCYTKEGLDENSCFVYVSYEVKIEGIDTKAPGLTAFYVYTDENGELKIDGNLEENINAAFKLVTSQDDVVDLYKKIDVSYNEAVAADENLNVFMTELPTRIKTSVGEALAQLEIEGNTDVNSEKVSSTEVTEETATETVSETHENQTVNQIVKATDTVNVRSSDSEEADKIGRIVAGTEITRVEERVNGWSKVVFEGKEAYIKSDYLEVVSSEDIQEEPESEGDGINDTETSSSSANTVTARTNVNVRKNPNQQSDKLGTVVAEETYKVLGTVGEWYKIEFNGEVGYVKSEFFD